MVERAGFREGPARRGGRASPLLSQVLGPRPPNRALERAAGRRAARTGGSCARRARARAARRSSPIPAELHPERARGARAASAIEQLYSHQAEALRRRLRRGRRSSPPAPRRGSRCASTCRRCDVLCRDAARARAVPLSDQGARPGPGARARRVRPGQARAPGDLRRRHAARGARGRSASSATSCSRTPTCCTSGILPNHGAWADLFANLAVVVVDEAHVYRGVFGSHVANVLRRLRRIAAAYGTEPRFLLASATIANPVELAERLTGLEDVRADRRGRLARRRSGRSRCGTRR